MRQALKRWNLFAITMWVFMTIATILYSTRVVNQQNTKAQHPSDKTVKSIMMEPPQLSKKIIPKTNRRAKLIPAATNTSLILNQRQPTNPEKLEKLVYIKIAKSGSTTVHRMLNGYGYYHHLHLIIPTTMGEGLCSRELNPGLSWDIAPDRKKPPQMSVEHARYNRLFFDKYFSNNTAYIASIRDPRTWIISYVDYMNRKRRLKDSPRDVLHNAKLFYEGVPGVIQLDRKVHNPLLQWFGFYMPHNYKYDEKKVLDYIKLIDKKFHLVMMTEYLSESLILLRRLMGWSMKDVFHIHINEATYKSGVVFSKEENEKLLDADHNRGDWLLYQHFNKTFWDKVSKEKDFHEEVNVFKKLNNRVIDFCNSKEFQKDNSLKLNLTTKWETGIMIDDLRCLTMIGGKFFPVFKEKYAPFQLTVDISQLGLSQYIGKPWPGLI